MSSARNGTGAFPDARSEDLMISATSSLSDVVNADDVYTKPKPDPIGKFRRKVMRDFQRDPEFRSLHPNVKKTIAHAVMRHMHPRDGFFMRQGKFADELKVSLRTVNRHLLKAEERKLFTNQGSMYTRTWKGVNTYRVHPRFLTDDSRPVSEGVLGGVVTKKFYKEASAAEAALSEANAVEAPQYENNTALSAEAPSAEEQGRLDRGLGEPATSATESAPLGVGVSAPDLPAANASVGKKTLREILEESFVHETPGNGSASCQDGQPRYEVAF